MNGISIIRSLCLVIALAMTLLAGCSSDSTVVLAPAPPKTRPLDSGNLNLIFVVSPDLDHPGNGDINPDTANLSNQGLQRSLLMANFLKQQVLGGYNVTGIYALAPMTHLQTAYSFPDLAALAYIQQFALLNQITLTGSAGTLPITAATYPINTTYAPGTIPGGVSAPVPACPDCQGLYFDDTQGNNGLLVNSIVTANTAGFHVFCAPWKTISAMMTNLNRQKGYNLNIPAAYMDPNYVHAISIAPSGNASLATYNSNLKPPATYPVLPAPLASATCPDLNSTPALFSQPVTGGVNGAVIPAGINRNQTVYLVRHAEAHPATNWDDGNYLAAGQWRALALPNALGKALRGNPSPTQVYSVDPAQVEPGALAVPGNFNFSYVRPALTVEPYAIANNLPFYLVSDIEIFDLTSPEIPLTRMFFFFNPKFNNQTLLVAWEHSHFPYIINDLFASYYPPNGAGAPAFATNAWPETDYDTIWTVTLDAKGNLTVNNALCEGIDSTLLPGTAPHF